MLKMKLSKAINCSGKMPVTILFRPSTDCALMFCDPPQHSTVYGAVISDL